MSLGRSVSLALYCGLVTTLETCHEGASHILGAVAGAYSLQPHIYGVSASKGTCVMPCREQSAAYPGTLPVPQAPIVCKGLATRQGQGHSSQIRGVALMDASRLCHDVQASLGAEHYRGADDACVDVRRWARAPSACVYVCVAGAFALV